MGIDGASFLRKRGKIAESFAVRADTASQPRLGNRDLGLRRVAANHLRSIETISGGLEKFLQGIGATEFDPYTASGHFHERSNLK